jgi:hypothetical protein
VKNQKHSRKAAKAQRIRKENLNQIVLPVIVLPFFAVPLRLCVFA